MSDPTPGPALAADPDSHLGGAAPGSLREYGIGLALSLFLTVLAFAVVGLGDFSRAFAITVILLTAVAQVFVQLVFFLHMNGSSEQFWNTLSAVFVVILVAILIVGSIWIMQHLNHNMLLGH